MFVDIVDVFWHEHGTWGLHSHRAAQQRNAGGTNITCIYGDVPKPPHLRRAKLQGVCAEGMRRIYIYIYGKLPKIT